jgi:hypothetical protein
MADMNHEAVVSGVMERLGDPAFRKLLTAVAPNGDRPIIPALNSDLFKDVLQAVDVHGGVGNVCVPVKNGYFVLSVTTNAAGEPGASGTAFGAHPHLTAACTMGVLLARLVQDGNEGERFTYLVSDDSPETAQAELIGVAT